MSYCDKDRVTPFAKALSGGSPFPIIIATLVSFMPPNPWAQGRHHLMGRLSLIILWTIRRGSATAGKGRPC